MNKTIVIISGIIVAGLLIGYYLYLNNVGNVAKSSLKGNTQILELVESYPYDSDYTVREIIDNKLHGFKGDFKVIGWETKRIDEQTLLASFMYNKNGRDIGWFFEVKSGRIIRDVFKDKELMKKYNLVNATVFTEEDMAELISVKIAQKNYNPKAQTQKERDISRQIKERTALLEKFDASDEGKRYRHLTEKRIYLEGKCTAYKEGILMLKQE